MNDKNEQNGIKRTKRHYFKLNNKVKFSISKTDADILTLFVIVIIALFCTLLILSSDGPFATNNWDQWEKHKIEIKQVSLAESEQRDQAKRDLTK